MIVIISGGVEVGHYQGSQRLLAPTGDGDLLQIPGMGDLGGRRQLFGGGKELFKGKGDLEEDDVNPQHKGVGSAGVRIIFKDRGAGDAYLQIGDLGAHPLRG